MVSVGVSTLTPGTVELLQPTLIVSSLINMYNQEVFTRTFVTEVGVLHRNTKDKDRVTLSAILEKPSVHLVIPDTCTTRIRISVSVRHAIMYFETRKTQSLSTTKVLDRDGSMSLKCVCGDGVLGLPYAKHHVTSLGERLNIAYLYIYFLIW